MFTFFFFFQVLEMSWYLCEIVGKQGKNHAQKLGLLATIRKSLYSATHSRSGWDMIVPLPFWIWILWVLMICEVGLNLLLITECRIWHLWDAFSKTSLIFTVPLGKMIAHDCSYTTLCIPCPSPVGGHSSHLHWRGKRWSYLSLERVKRLFRSREELHRVLV